MKRFLKNYRLPENIKVLFMLMIGIVLQMTDGSPFSLEERWLVVWETELPSQYFSQFVQQFIKTVLSIIVVVRCLTTYAYVVSAMLVICSIVKNTSPKLMLLWLLIAALKSVFMTFLEALTGVYVCSAFGKIRKACIEFFISKALEIIFAAYLWASVLSIYHEMERKAEESNKSEAWEQLFAQKTSNRRQRTRSLLDESTLYKTACLNYFEFKDVPQIILQMLTREEEMSEDSLLGPGMMLASVSNLGSFDNLKTSQSLGELGLVDLQSTQVMGLEDDETLSPPDKALKFLKLTWSDVRKAQRNKETVESEVFAVDDDTWNKVTAKGANMNKPKLPRAEIFLREIPALEKESERELPKKHRSKSLQLKFGWSLINFFQEQDAELNKTFDEQDEEISSIAYNQEENEDEPMCEDEPSIFMSNVRDEILVNRIRLDFVSRAAKGNAYENLYKQDYMSVIGPEVFEKASKLPKVTSFTKYHDRIGLKRSSSLPEFSETSGKWKRKITFDDEGPEKEEITSKSELWINTSEQAKAQDSENSNDGFILTSRKSDHHTSAENSTESEELSRCHSSKSLPCQETQDATSDTENEADNEVSGRKYSLKIINDKANNKENVHCDSTDPCQENIPCFKSRKIRIKRIGRQIQNCSELPLFNDNVSPNESENDSDNSSSSKTSSECVSKTTLQETEFRSKGLGSDDDAFRGESDGSEKGMSKRSSNQFFFFAKLMQLPLIDVLIAYYDLKNKLSPQRNADDLLYMEKLRFQNTFFETHQILRECDKLTPFLLLGDNINTKEWKSKVLKTVTANYSLKTNQKSIQDEFMVKFFKWKIAVEKNLVNNYSNLLADPSYRLLNRFNILKDDNNPSKKGRALLKKRQHDNSVFLDSSDSDDSAYSVEDTVNQKNRTEDSLNSSCISVFSDSSNTSESYESFQNVVSQIESFGVNPDRPELIRNWLNSSFAEEHNSNDVSVKTSETTTYQEKPGTSINFESDTNIAELARSMEENKIKGFVSASEVANNIPDQDSLGSQDSDEPFSLYYSKAADLASPLLDMRRFIYPDHIHYSYKHVKKKGFDVDISGGLPLIVRESLTMNTPLNMKNVSAPSPNPKIGITRKPMDLSFATTNAFTEWQNSDKGAVPSESDTSRKDSSQNLQNPRVAKHEKKSSNSDQSKSKKIKKSKRPKRSRDADQNYRLPKSEEVKKSRSKSQFRNAYEFKHFYTIKDYLVLKKILKMYRGNVNTEVNKTIGFPKGKSPIQISSTQLHSNKGRINSTYNPAISLHENKTRTEKKKMETQERTKVMFARLKREVLLQTKNANRTFGPLRHI